MLIRMNSIYEVRIIQRITVVEPSVSVVIPAHNEEKLIAETLGQLFDVLAELRIDHEIIVVNDDSTDQTAAIAENSGAVVLNVKFRNIGAVRNAGAKSAKNKYLVFVDADTLVPLATIQATIDALESGITGGGAMVELADGPSIHWSKYWLFPLLSTIWLKLGCWAAGCYMFCDRRAFEEIGGFPEEYFAAEEFFFSRRIKHIGRFVILEQPVQTSPRKLNDYSVWQLLRFATLPFFSLSGMLKSRKGLEILYEHRRNPN